MERSRFTVEVGGMDFVLRRITTGVALAAFGAKAAGMVAASKAGSVDVDPKKAVEVMEAYLRACMISPALGDKTDDESDTITWEDFCATGLEAELFTKLFVGSGMEKMMRDFRKLQEEVTE
jgi:hypothetical protein